jgi:hypothetical protein
MKCYHCKRIITRSMQHRGRYYYTPYRDRWATRRRCWCCACVAFVTREPPTPRPLYVVRPS